jgi:putative ABC transport system permease protein
MGAALDRDQRDRPHDLGAGMRWLLGIRMRLRAVIFRQRVEAELDEELQYHLDRQAEQYASRGIPSDEARATAMREFGGMQRRREECQDAWGLRVLDGAALDCRLAWRSLRRSPLVASAIAVSLALGIGSAGAIFSLLDAVSLRPLPVPHPDRLVVMASTQEPQTAWPQPVWREIRDRGLLDQGFAWYWTRFDTGIRGERQLVSGVAASGRMFDCLQVHPTIGRLLDASDDVPVPTVANISYGYWRRQYGGSADVLGQTILLNERAFTIVGVLPRAFSGLDIGLPLDVQVPLGALGGSDAPYVTIVGRLRDGESLDLLTALVRVHQASIRAATNPYDASPYREEYMREPLQVETAARGMSFLERRYAEPLRALLAVVALVLVMASVNLGLVLLARAIARAPELTTRLALGATRTRLAFELAVEGAFLGIAGVGLGALFAAWWCNAILASLSNQLYRISLDLTPDWRVLAFASGIAILAVTAFSIAPVLYVSRLEPLQALSQRATPSRRIVKHVGWVIVSQVAISVVLVALTGLFLKTYWMLATAKLGVDADRVLVCTVRVADAAAATRTNLLTRIRVALRALPGVDEVAGSVALPGGQSALTPWLALPDGTPLPQGPHGVYANRVSVGWFAALGTQVLAGRDFLSTDRVGSPRVAVVNRAFADAFLRGREAVGATILERDGPDGQGQPLVIVGIVQDAMYRFVKETAPPTVYTSIDQLDNLPGLHVSVRAAMGTRPAELARAVSVLLSNVEAQASFELRTLDDQIGAQYSRERLVARVAGVFGVAAVLLVAFGLYGVTSYSVGWRRIEIGIRTAVGATPSRLAWWILSGALLRTCLGLIVGLAAAFSIGRMAAPLLYGVEATDRTTFTAAAVLLLAVATLAGWIPVRRAVSESPANVLRGS